MRRALTIGPFSHSFLSSHWLFFFLLLFSQRKILVSELFIIFQTPFSAISFLEVSFLPVTWLLLLQACLLHCCSMVEGPYWQLFQSYQFVPLEVSFIHTKAAILGFSFSFKFGYNTLSSTLLHSVNTSYSFTCNRI